MRSLSKPRHSFGSIFSVNSDYPYHRHSYSEVNKKYTSRSFTCIAFSRTCKRSPCLSMCVYIDLCLYNFLKSNIFCPCLRQQILLTLNFLVFVLSWYFGDPVKGKLSLKYFNFLLVGNFYVVCALVGKNFVGYFCCLPCPHTC